VDVNLPLEVNKPDQKVAPSEQIVIEYNADRSMAVNKQPVTIATLQDTLRDIFETRREKTMFIVGDPSLRYGEIIAVIDAGRGAGVEKVGIVTEGMRRGERHQRQQLSPGCADQAARTAVGSPGSAAVSRLLPVDFHDLRQVVRSAGEPARSAPWWMPRRGRRGASGSGQAKPSSCSLHGLVAGARPPVELLCGGRSRSRLVPGQVFLYTIASTCRCWASALSSASMPFRTYPWPAPAPAAVLLDLLLVMRRDGW
jgi:hypothetical protein